MMPRSRISLTKRKNAADEKAKVIRTTVYEMEALVAMMGAAFVVAAGVAMAHICLFVVSPKCVREGSIVAGPTVPTSPMVRSSPAATTAVVVGSATGDEHSGFSPTAKFPPVCSSEEMRLLQQQLSREGCLQNAKKPWMFQQCSFAKESMCGNANPHFLYDFWHEASTSSSQADPFRGIIVGCNKGYEAIEVLRISNGDNNKKYDLLQWAQEFVKVDGDAKVDEGIDCPPDRVATTGSRPSKVYCIEGIPTTVRQLEKTKAALGYKDDELEFANLVVNSVEDEGGMKVMVRDDPIGFRGAGTHHWSKQCRKDPIKCETVPITSIDDFIYTKDDLKKTKTATATAPIQYLSITAEGSDYDILKGAANNLKRIEYIDFGYHWNWAWGFNSFKDLVFRLKRKGFVCYFIGNQPNANKNKLWRITDCWQDHYDIKYPASVACVNADLPSAAPLLERMEAIFHETLK